MDWTPLLVEGGPWALISLIVVSVLRGWLIPRSVHESRVRDLKETIARYQAANARREQQVATLAAPVQEPCS